MLKSADIVGILTRDGLSPWFVVSVGCKPSDKFTSRSKFTELEALASFLRKKSLPIPEATATERLFSAISRTTMSIHERDWNA